MGIDKESDIAADLQIAPTTLGMVRFYVAGEGIDLPLDFEPEEAEEIAEEIRLAAQQARVMAAKPERQKGKKPKAPKPGAKPPGKAPRR
ncbi:DUF6324 family protein [Frigidibacter sp. ROC022]|uniref:DUF6324 family protein n=1 Tax=Frigidibacter sp. ROC022 TaxID=2971796 RepID=UPI00215A4C34|nr:DUF6324 family protein [Frigidibacter sp. ROC022]MCR8725308.1 DUF6324 family protein [Frigidibacter sp. ROC022]